MSAWNPGSQRDGDTAGEADDALIDASAKPKKRPRTQLTDKEMDAMRTALKGLIPNHGVVAV